METAVLLDPSNAAKLCAMPPEMVSGRRRCGRRFLPRSCFSGDFKANASISAKHAKPTGSCGGGGFLQSEIDIFSIAGENSGDRYWTSALGSIILQAYEDDYGGLIVDPDTLPRDPAVFAYALRTSLSSWKSAGRKGIWLKLPAERAELVPVAVKEGFQYHHAEQAYLMLTYWIPAGPSMLPANASHQVGVGGFVINDQMEVLVVQEKFCSPASNGSWKLPTGFILENEEIFSGAVREVKEETGVDSEFLEVVAFRHAHQVAFEKSDLLFICMLRALSHQIKIDGVEIQAAKWMPLAEFAEQPLIQDDGMFKKIIDICIQRVRKRYCGLKAHPVISMFDGRPSSLYYNVSDEHSDRNCRAA